MTKTTKSFRLKSVRKVNALIKDGLSISKARSTVAKELDVTPNTLYNWSRSLNIATPTITVSTTKFARNSNIVTRTGEYSFSDMAGDVRGVMRSIVKQDGKYTIKEANVVGKLYSTEISRAKLQLEVHKHNTKISSKDKHNNMLSLT